MPELINLDDAVTALLKEQEDDIEAYGCPIPECFDGDRAVRVLAKLPTIDTDISGYSDRLWKLAYERGQKEGGVRCKDCKYRDADGYCQVLGDMFIHWEDWTPVPDDFFCSRGTRS